MKNEVTNMDLDLSLLKVIYENKRLEQEKKIAQAEKDRIAEEKLKIKIYKSKTHKKRKKLIKFAMIGTLVVAASFATAKKAHTIVTEADVVYYEVQQGDTLNEIASRFHVSVEELMRDNASKIGPGGVIYPGEVLAFITSPKLVDEYKEAHDMQENKDEWFGRSR